MPTEIDDWTNAIHTGDAFDVVADLPDESIHAVVTDPPYGLNFMGEDWDNFRRKHNDADVGRENVFGRTSSTSPAHGAETEGKRYQEWCEEWAREVKRVLKPGGHLLAFSGNRTHHRLFTGVEDAGFEIRDTLTWHYGSGFPKASDVSKTIDKRTDAEREVVRTREANDIRGDNYNQSDETMEYEVTAPATDAAKKWDGWKTGLKPATEFVVMARKPYDGATVDSVLENGTGALNIEACRVGDDVDTTRPDGPNNPEIYGPQTNDDRGSDTGGRYPANVIFDEVAADALDAEVGELADSTQNTSKRGYDSNVYGDKVDHEAGGASGYEGSGGPSRYFYTSKASRSERTNDGAIENDHPTVKPRDLMEWLIRLVTREGQIVLDPFAGSGTTCTAAKALQREFVGIERQAKYADVARVRCGLTPDDPSSVREDGVVGLEAFADD